MVYNKIIANNQTVLDISDDTVDSDKVLRGISFHKNSGEKANGTIETYAGDTNITENKVLPTAGTYLNSDITVNVSGVAQFSPEYVSFRGYRHGDSLDLSGLKTDKVTDMRTMFEGCEELTSLNLSGFDTSKVTDMSYMFSGCSALTSLDLSSFKTGKVTNMEWMFSACRSLTHLDLSNFDFTNVTSYDRMFVDVPDNCEILVKDEAAKTWIIRNCPEIVNFDRIIIKGK